MCITHLYFVCKFDEAVHQRAAGILLIHTTEAAGYPWSVVADGRYEFHSDQCNTEH
jgi:hypothetical protein